MGHAVELIDPLSIELPAAFKPHFAYAKGAAPEALDALAGKIDAADGYVMVSPEYNHSMSPTLAHLLNHFGSSLFAYKPSAIVTYSAGQWGGARAAVNMRTFLSELGCLPVSAMIHLPKAQDILTETGDLAEGINNAAWQGYFGRTLAQLDWWAAAAPTKAYQPQRLRLAAIRHSVMPLEVWSPKPAEKVLPLKADMAIVRQPN